MWFDTRIKEGNLILDGPIDRYQFLLFDTPDRKKVLRRLGQFENRFLIQNPRMKPLFDSVEISFFQPNKPTFMQVGIRYLDPVNPSDDSLDQLSKLMIDFYFLFDELNNDRGLYNSRFRK